MPRPRQLLIVANGLREQSGHYFETTVALAEAARRFDCRPVVGAHVDCPASLLPEDLESHRIFRTDHWMRPSTPRLLRERESVDGGWDRAAPSDRLTNMNSIAAMPRQIDDRGIAGRPRVFTVAAQNRPASAPATVADLRQTARGAARLAKVAARYAMPPVAYDLARVVVYACLPRMVRRQQWNLARQDFRVAAIRWKYGEAAERVEQAAAWPAIASALDDLGIRRRLIEAFDRLAPLGLLAELNHALIFREDLERFLKACGAGPEDHVLLPTAHARELLAVHLIVERLTLAASPVFHLEFRHPLFEGDIAAETIDRSPGAMMQRAFFLLHAGWGTSSRIRFYTDAAALARDYESISGLMFDVLPLPFRAELIPNADHRPTRALTVAYLGGARDEKGFHWLPNLVRQLRMRNSGGRVRFLFQSNIGQPEHNPRSIAALSELRSLSGDDMELVAAHDGLPPADYYRLFSRCDVIVLPYLPPRYRACTSGILAEAIAASVPVVVPAETWLSNELPSGAGEVFAGPDSFINAVQRVIDEHSQYQAAARAARRAWLTRHSPDAIVGALLRSAHQPFGPLTATVSG